MATIVENIQTLQSIKSDIKNAIIQKGGSVTDAFGGYAQAITNLPSGGGGGTEIEDALVTRTLSGTYSNDRVSKVGDYTFYYYLNLASVNLPNCLSVGNHAFYFCAFSSIYLPLCTHVGSNAFGGNKSLTSIDLSNCISVSNGAFGWCSALSLVRLPICTFIHSYVFNECTNLKEVYLNSVPFVTNIQLKTFSKCPNLTSIYVPASLVDAFKTAQYWSSISDKIVAYREIAGGGEIGGEIGGGEIGGGEIGTEDIL